MADDLPSQETPILLQEAPPEEGERPLELRSLLAHIAYLQHANHTALVFLVFLVPYAIGATGFIVYLLLFWPRA